MTGFDAPQTLARPPEPKRPSVGSALAMFGSCAVAGAVVSLLVGWLWVRFSDPPSVPLARGGGIFLGEEALNRESGITLWFFVLGLGFGLVAGLVIGWFGQRYGWLSVVAVLLLCVVATVLTRYLGIHVFGADPHQQAEHAAVGDLIQIDVSVDSWVAYLGWPIGGLVGVLGAIAAWSKTSHPPYFADNSHIMG